MIQTQAPRTIHSLSTRLLASVSILLIIFFSITIVLLDLLFRDLSDRAMHERLELQLRTLISASEETPGAGLLPVLERIEPRFNNPASGLYGEILRDDGKPSWRSDSLTGTGLQFPSQLRAGQSRFSEIHSGGGPPALALSMGIEWEFNNKKTRLFVFNVAESLEPYYAQLDRFRVQLLGGFSAVMLLLLGALALLLRRLLKPLRRVEQEIEAIEAGAMTEVGGGYPRELLGITTNLNKLLNSERERLARYRNTLGNLAHSFKTPLAVMRNLLHGAQVRDLAIARQLDEQVGRMDDLVKHQLKRAAASGGTGLGTAPAPVRAALDELRGALLKVYLDRNLDCELRVAEGCLYFGDREDLTEIAGNLLDNAFKWAQRRVRCTAVRIVAPQARREGLALVIEDDGPGIPADEHGHVLERGARLDERVGGQGIGLSVVRELVQLNGGTVTIGTSDFGGARIEVRLPPV